MNVILFGATGMVGQGVLRECLLDPQVHAVLSVGRSTTEQADAKLRELVHRDLLDYSAIEADLSGFDACFFCLGVSSAGMTEEAYRLVTYDITQQKGSQLLTSAASILAAVSESRTSDAFAFAVVGLVAAGP